MRTALSEPDLRDQQSQDGAPDVAPDAVAPDAQVDGAHDGSGAGHEPKVRLMVPAKKSAEGKVLVPAHPLDVSPETAPGAEADHRAASRPLVSREGVALEEGAGVPEPEGLARSSEDEAEDDPALYPQATKGATWIDRLEAFLSRLSTRDNFWQRVFSLLFLPLAFWSGIRMRRGPDGQIDDAGTFTAVLPFTKFNKNWYNAMAGASLLANTEIAGGMYVFGEAGGEYTVVCKNLNYTFLRPCYGPAVYRAVPRQDLKALLAAGGEFNITLDMDIRQLGVKPGQREKRVGRAEITFHATPKGHAKVRQKKLKQRDRQRSQIQRGRGT